MDPLTMCTFKTLANDMCALEKSNISDEVYRSLHPIFYYSFQDISNFSLIFLLFRKQYYK